MKVFPQLEKIRGIVPMPSKKRPMH